jgi:hypothetical protein
MAAVLTSARRPLALCLGAGNFIKCLCPLDRHLESICLLLGLGSFRGGGSCPLIGGGRAWLASRRSPASIDLVGATPLLAKRPLEEFHHLCRLWPPQMKSLAGCWCSWPFDRSRPLWPNAVVIPGTSAGRWFCPWPTQIVIPTTGGANPTDLLRAMLASTITGCPRRSHDASTPLAASIPRAQP